MRFGTKVFAGKERVEDSNSVEVKSVLVFAEVLKELGQSFCAGKTP